MEKETATAIAKRDEESSGLSLSQMFNGMLDLAKDPDVDPAKMEAILGMQERMIDRQARSEYQKAMHAARAKMPRIQKDGRITNKAGQVQSRYAHYEAIDQIVRPLVEEEGLTYGFDFKEGEQGRVLVTCIVSHVGGHEERFGPMPLSIDTTGSKNATQGAGSAGKYGQRYTLCAAFNIVTVGEDDDGNMGRASSGSIEKKWTQLLEDAQRAAIDGTDAYQKWFKDRTNLERGWLLDEGHHESLKRSAADHD
jgi:hypothetical protein